jgi:hypothetical protein
LERRNVELNLEINADNEPVEFKSSNKYETKVANSEGSGEELEQSCEHEYLDGEENFFGIAIIKTRTKIADFFKLVKSYF